MGVAWKKKRKKKKKKIAGSSASEYEITSTVVQLYNLSLDHAITHARVTQWQEDYIIMNCFDRHAEHLRVLGPCAVKLYRCSVVGECRNLCHQLAESVSVWQCSRTDETFIYATSCQ